MQDRLGQANVLKARGDLAQATEDWTAALRWYEEALPIYGAVQDRVGASNVYAEFAKVRSQTGAFEEARVAATTARSLGAQCHNRYAVAVAEQVLAALAQPSP